MTGVELFTLSMGAASTAVTLADAFAVVGTLVSAAGAVSQGNQQQAVNEANAAQLEVDAIQAQKWAEFEEERLRERSKSLLATQQNIAGSQSGSLEGTPVLLLAETAVNEELDALAVRYSGSVEAARSRGAAALERMEGEIARNRGFGDAFGTLLSGGSRVADRIEKRLGE